MLLFFVFAHLIGAPDTTGNRHERQNQKNMWLKLLCLCSQFSLKINSHRILPE